jgi:polyisoprenoid-binding protein YceI
MTSARLQLKEDDFMRRLLAVLTVAPLLALLAPSARADDYAIDQDHTSVSFQIKHLDLSWVHGRFNTVTGTLTIDPANPDKSSLEVTIPVESLDTNNKKRDAHLLGPDFFDAQKYPQIVFKSKSIKPVKEGLEVSGDFTIHGVTRPVTFTLKGGKTAEFPKGVQRTGYSTELVIKRTQFGMDKLVGPVGDEVYIAISFEGVKK